MTDIVVTDEVYASPGGGDLWARVFAPLEPTGPRPVVVDVHGGAWRYFDRTVDDVQCRGLAAAGFVVVAVDFRQAPEVQWPVPLDDLAAALSWVRANAARLGADPEAVLLMGGSSGGHLALWAALRDRGVRGVLALWPIASPDLRYRYLLDRLARDDATGDDPMFDAARLARAHDRFFGDEATMAAASVPALLAAGDTPTPPPLWVAHPELDENVTPEMTELLAVAWRAAGGDATVVPFPGVGHSFVNFGGPAADRCLALMIPAARRMVASARQEAS